MPVSPHWLMVATLVGALLLTAARGQQPSYIVVAGQSCSDSGVGCSPILDETACRVAHEHLSLAFHAGNG